MSGRAWAPAGLVLAAALLAGCGIASENAPRPIAPPRGIPQGTSTPTPTPTASGPVAEQLFMVRDGALVMVTRHVEAAPTAAGLVSDLLAGPTTKESDAGLTSALLGGDLVASIQVRDGDAVVELASAIQDTARNDEVLAYAQLVCTLTSRPDIGGVAFTRDGQSIGVPRADGSLSTGPLTMADYESLLASPTPSAPPS